MRPLHDGPDCNAERLAAVLALVDAGARALALQLGDPIASDAAARTMRTERPEQPFQVLTSRVVIMENWIANIEFCVCHTSNIGMVCWYVNRIIPRCSCWAERRSRR